MADTNLNLIETYRVKRLTEQEHDDRLHKNQNGLSKHKIARKMIESYLKNEKNRLKLKKYDFFESGLNGVWGIPGKK